MPELQSLLQQTLCDPFSRCEGLHVGSAEDQVLIVRSFYELAGMYDIRQGAAYVMRALLAHDLLKAVDLAHSFDAYSQLLDLLSRSIASLPPVIDDSPTSL